MYVNYGFTVAVVIVGYFSLEWWTHASLTLQLVLWGSVSILCPLILFRRARGLWLSFDYLLNPGQGEPRRTGEE
jgi:uncharacterized protein (DUF983 family)